MSAEMVVAVIVVSVISAWIASSITVRISAWIWARNLPHIKAARAEEKRFNRELRELRRLHQH